MNVVYKDLFMLKDKSIMLKILPSLLEHSHIVKRFASIEFYQVQWSQNKGSYSSQQLYLWEWRHLKTRIWRHNLQVNPINIPIRSLRHHTTYKWKCMLAKNIREIHFTHSIPISVPSFDIIKASDMIHLYACGLSLY